MPELPDVQVYTERLRVFIGDTQLERIRLASPFVLRSVEPATRELEGKRITGIQRLGKRLVIGVGGDDFIVIHLMVAGRLHWRRANSAIPKGRGLAAFDFRTGTLILTEAGKKRRASIHLVRGTAKLGEFDPGGLELLSADVSQFGAALRRENHTLKRALTDPRILSGIGNAYSDEILHRARMSPFKNSATLTDEESSRLFHATVDTLSEWTDRIRTEVGKGFPEKVTAFRQGMAVHGRYGEPCPVCGAPIQRIVYAENEANYCAGCQTSGKILADRALSRLLKASWPKTLDELENRRSKMD